MGVSVASLMHLALARVLGVVSGATAVVFGTVLLGRMEAGEGGERALGMFINTLPLRVDVGEQSVRAGVQATHERLTALLAMSMLRWRWRSVAAGSRRRRRCSARCSTTATAPPTEWPR